MTTDTFTPAALLVAAERTRHITEEGFDADHDAQYNRRGHSSPLAWAAACLAAPERIYQMERLPAGAIAFVDPFPSEWDARFDKRPRIHLTPFDNSPAYVNRGQRVRQLLYAASMLCAEADRIRRNGDPIPDEVLASGFPLPDPRDPAGRFFLHLYPKGEGDEQPTD